MPDPIESKEGGSGIIQNLGLKKVYPSSEFELFLQYDRRRLMLPALLYSNSEFDPLFSQGIAREDKPNGHLIGVGVGDILTLVPSFSSGEPKSVVCIDIDPAVILTAKILIEGLKRHSDWESFATNLLLSPRIEQVAREVVEGETDDSLKDAMRSNIPRFRYEIRIMWRKLLFNFGGYFREAKERIDEKYPQLAEPNDYKLVPLSEDSAMEEARIIMQFPFVDSRIDRGGFLGIGPIISIARYYNLFHRLAVGDKMAVVYSSIFDHDLLHDLAKLPEIDKSTNIIYLANALRYVEGVLKGGKDAQSLKEAAMRNARSLHILDSEGPKKNIYVRQISGKRGDRSTVVLVKDQQPPELTTAGIL